MKKFLINKITLTMKKLIITLTAASIIATNIFGQEFKKGSTEQLIGYNSVGLTSPLTIGIGTTNPLNKLHIVGDEATDGRTFIKLHNTNNGFNSATGIRISASNDESSFANISYGGSTYTNPSTFAEGFNLLSSGQSLNLFASRNSGIIRHYVGSNAAGQSVEMMRLTGTGLGIKVAAPTAVLHTKGSIKLESLDAGNSFILTRDTDGTLKSSTTSLTDINATITDLKNRLKTAEDEIAVLKKKVGMINTEDISTFKVVLAQNEPNPAIGTTKINFTLPQTSNNAQILIFDVQGKLVDKYEFANVAGKQELSVSTTKFVAGIYFYSLFVNGKEIDTKKMIISE
jgi:Secretion system C-terminal sorting domain